MDTESAEKAEFMRTYCPACGHATSLAVEVLQPADLEGTAHQCCECGVNWTLQSAHEAAAARVVVADAQIRRTDSAVETAADLPDGRGESGGPHFNRRLTLLSPREREVMDLVVAGRTNGETAQLLSVSVSSIEKHRARAMKKLLAKTLVDVIRMYIDVAA
jgi:DNA-binding CsgD family transcriptional regulator